MQSNNFDIRKSNKAYIEAPEQFIVVHGGVVYLRIVGQEGSYDVMTATSGEDTGAVFAFDDQHVLNQIAIEVAQQIGCAPEHKEDHQNRPYVKICNCEFLSDAYRAADILFDRLAT
jgi:hypothetical protein